MRIDGHRFLVTGGASLIGSHVADHLLAAGASEVILFDNLSLSSDPTAQPGTDPRLRLVRGDIRDIHALMDALNGIDGVFATAAYITNPLHRDPLTGMQVNVDGHLMLLEACRWRGVKRLIYSSSVGLYGASPAELIAESEPFHYAGLQPAGVLYGASKIVAEQLCRMYQDRHGLECTALRYSTVYGERQHARGVNSLIIVEAYDRIRQGLPPLIPGDGSEVHDYIHVADVARANVAAMRRDTSLDNATIATGNETSLNALVGIILDVVGSGLRPEHIDAPGRVKVTTTTRLRFDRSKAERELGWKPEVPLREGIKRVLEWRESEIRNNSPPRSGFSGSDPSKNASCPEIVIT